MRALAILFLFLGASLAAAGRADERKIVFLAAPDAAAALEAAALAMDEVLRQAEFLGIGYRMVVARPAEAADHDDAVAAIVVGSPEEILAAADALAEAQIPVFNATSRDDRLRSQCRPNLFHTIPSERMLADAAAQWKAARPADSDVAAHAWHGDFVKFSARELNRRWRESAGRAMTDADWGVWAAYKIVGDAVANNPEASPAELIAYLREEMEFDSVKGVESTFRANGQLAQPLLVTVGGKLAGEAPVRGVAAEDDLDSLGLVECQP